MPDPSTSSPVAPERAPEGIDIGIVVPAHNVADYIEPFFAYLRQQTYQGFRVVLVDDCSTDGSGDHYAHAGAWLGERLTILRNERNIGPGPTRNRGLDELCREPPTFVTFLDADDWFEPTYLEDLHGAAVEYAVDLSIAGIVRFDDADDRVLDVEMVSYPTERIADSAQLDELASINPCVYAKLYRFAPIKHLRFRKMLRSEDTCWLFEALPHLKTVKFTNHALFHYRVRGGSLTTTMGAMAVDDMHRVFAGQLRRYDDATYAPYRELFECQVFIRSSIGGVTRLAFSDLSKATAMAPSERRWLDEHMPSWRTNKYLSFGRWRSRSAKQLALKLCATLYKLHGFALFVYVYYFISRVLRKEVRA